MSQISQLLEKELTRKQFLLVLLSAVPAVFGLSTLMGALTKSTETDNANPGYGKQHYGP